MHGTLGFGSHCYSKNEYQHMEDYILSEDFVHKIPHGHSARHCRLTVSGRPNPAEHCNLAMGPYNVLTMSDLMGP